MTNIDPNKTKDTFDKSQLIRWCIGIIAETKPDDVDKVKVYPVEHLNLEHGDILEIDEIEAAVPDKDGVIKTSISDRKKWLYARWLPDGADGRQSAPDVVSGETVQLYRFSDSETIYWKTEFRERELRRLEHVVHAYSNLKEGREEFQLDSSYGNTFSTKRKYIQIWTTNSDGEAFEYTFTINTADSTVKLKDDIDNMVEIDSPIHRVRCINNDGTYTDHIGPDLHALAVNALTHTSASHTDKSGVVVHDTPTVINTGSMVTANNHHVGTITSGPHVATAFIIGGPGGPSVSVGRSGRMARGGGGGRDVGESLIEHDQQIAQLQAEVKALQGYH